MYYNYLYLNYCLPYLPFTTCKSLVLLPVLRYILQLALWYALIASFRKCHKLLSILTLSHGKKGYCPPYSYLLPVGSAIALESGDITIFTTDLRCIGPIIQLGRAAERIIYFNIAVSVVSKVWLHDLFCICEASRPHHVRTLNTIE